MTTYASQKAGTSPATRQKENDFGAVFTLTTACSGGACVATVVDGPAPSNPTIPPQPTRYTWNGAEWATTYDWVWDCFLGDGYQKQWSPATSWAFYTPRSPTDPCAARGTPTSRRDPAAAASSCPFRQCPPDPGPPRRPHNG